MPGRRVIFIRVFISGKHGARAAAITIIDERLANACKVVEKKNVHEATCFRALATQIRAAVMQLVTFIVDRSTRS